MAVTTGKSERLNLRIDADSKETLKRAAAFAGSKLTDFVVSNALAAADEVIRTHEAVALSKGDWDAFLDALENPPKPGARLKKALKRHDELHG